MLRGTRAYSINPTTSNTRGPISPFSVEYLSCIQMANILKPSQLKSLVFTQKRLFSQCFYVSAKGDASTIDFYKIPTRVWEAKPPGPIMKIPSLTSESSRRQPTAVKFEAEPEAKVLQLANDSVVATIGDTIDSHIESGHESDELSSNDKSFLLALGGGILAWWFLVPGRKPKEI